MMANMLLYIGDLGVTELLIALIPSLLWLYAVVEILTKAFKNGTDKIVWLLVVLLLPVLGLIIYYIFGRSRLARS